MISHERQIEFLFGTIIIGGLGFLILKTIDMNGALNGISKEMSATSARVERIAQALPDVGVRIASEEISRPIRTVVVTENPKQNPDGTYETTLNVVDSLTLTRWRLSLSLQSEKDMQTLGNVAWAGYDLDPSYASFSQMQAYSHALAIHSSLPVAINKKISFVLRETSGEEYINRISWLQGSLITEKIDVRTDSWKDIVEELEKVDSILYAGP